MTVFELAQKYENYIIEMRRYFHENPELSGKEDNTIKKIGEELSLMGIEYVDLKPGGILAKISGNSDSSRAVLLRADVDALMIDEAEENLRQKKTCVSKVSGVMHACGHDGHTAMLLGAAKILSEKKNELNGTVYLCFERGEEGTDDYLDLFRYIDENGIKIDTAFAIHLLSSQPSGKMVINDSAMMAGNMSFYVTLIGEGGHGSRPDEANSPIDCFTAIYQRLQALRLARVSPFETVTYSVGFLKAGSQSNVIPKTLEFSGMIRYLNPETEYVIEKEFKQTLEGIASAYGCGINYKLNLTNPSVVNYPPHAQIARRAIANEIGEENVITAEPWMASESFAHYLIKWRGVMSFLGIKNEELGTGSPNHSPEFDIDESALKNGSAGAAAYALEFLK